MGKAYADMKEEDDPRGPDHLAFERLRNDRTLQRAARELMALAGVTTNTDYGEPELILFAVRILSISLFTGQLYLLFIFSV